MGARNETSAGGSVTVGSSSAMGRPTGAQPASRAQISAMHRASNAYFRTKPIPSFQDHPWWMGSSTVKVAPLPSSLSTVTVPPCISTI